MAQDFRFHSVRVLRPTGFHAMAYTQWGDPQNPDVVMCVHGLTRNGRDFDELARALSDRYRVICPDVLGRGRSDQIQDPAGYAYPLYLADMATLIAHLNVETVDWVGTSMGGLIGMMLAATPGNPIKRLVMNDVGPFIPKAALDRIVTYITKTLTFETVDALEAHLRKIHAPFGDLSDQQWAAMAEHSHWVDGNGHFVLAYDPAIAAPFQDPSLLADVDLWAVWGLLTQPVFVVRGEESDLLSENTLLEMARRGPKASHTTIPNVGHAPALMDSAQIGLVEEFLQN